MSYFVRAANRASNAVPASPALAARPATAIDSPLVEEDQRLNLDLGEDFAVVPLAAHPPLSPDDAALPRAQGADPVDPVPVAPVEADTRQEPIAPDMFAQEPLIAPPDDPPSPDPPNQSNPEAVPVIEYPGPPPVDANAGTMDTSGTTDPEPPAPSMPTTAREKGRKPDDLQSSPLASMMKAVAAAERWVAEDPAPPQMVQPPRMADEAFATQDHQDTMSVVPILPPTMPDRPQPPAPHGPTVEIGQIEIEVVPPPAPAQPRPASSRPAAAPAPKAAVPFGWRQR